MSEDIERPFTEHLEELRSRIIKSLIAVVAATLALLPLSERMFSFLLTPLRSAEIPSLKSGAPEIIFTAPTEAFLTYMSICIYGGLLLASPVIIYQVWAFVSVALRENEKKNIIGIVAASSVLFLIGTVFSFTVIIPLGLRFLLGFGGAMITPMITVGRYISFLTTLTVAFGVVFQVPLIMVFLVRTGIVSSAVIASQRKAVIVLIFVVSALLTPPDVITQCLMAVPLFFLFETGLFLARMTEKKGGNKSES